MFQAMRGINEIKLFLDKLADAVGVTVLQIEPARRGSNWIGTTTNVYTATLRDSFFKLSPVGLRFCAFVHSLNFVFEYKRLSSR